MRKDEFTKEVMAIELTKGYISPRERDVLRLYYGLDGLRERTLEEVGQLFGVTRERVRQIKEKAIRNIKKRIGVEA